MKKISVIIPVHNTEKYLVSCLESVVNQTEKSIEIITVNDHSTDNSLKILKNYEKMYPYKIKVIDMKEKFGVSCARNEGLKIAQGKYIGFVDSDDFISLNMFHDFCKSLEYYNLPIAVGNAYRVSSTTELKEFYITEKEQPKTFNYEKYSSRLEHESPAVWDKVFLHDFIEGYFFLENHIYEDVGFTYPILLKAKEILEYYRCDYAYRYTPGSIMNQVSNIKPNVLDIIHVCHHAMERTKNWNLKEEERKVLIKIFEESIKRRGKDIEKWPLSESEKEKYMSAMLSIGAYYFPNLQKERNQNITKLSKNQISFYEENLKRSIKKELKKTSF